MFTKTCDSQTGSYDLVLWCIIIHAANIVCVVCSCHCSLSSTLCQWCTESSLTTLSPPTFPTHVGSRPIRVEQVSNHGNLRIYEYTFCFATQSWATLSCQTHPSSLAPHKLSDHHWWVATPTHPHTLTPSQATIEIPRPHISGTPPVILLNPKPVMSAGEFEQRWIKMVSA